MAGEGVVDHGDDRLKEGRKKDRNVWLLTEHFFVLCLRSVRGMLHLIWTEL